jgi:hypothetical protein
MNNPWIQAVIGSLIGTALFELIRRVFRINYPIGSLLIAVAVSTLVFVFGNILEPAVRVLLEGEDPFWTALLGARKAAPGFFVIALFVAGLLPGIITGLMVLKGRSFVQRLLYAVFWAPASLTLFDVAAFLLIRHQGVYEVASYGHLSFSLLSNILGGSVGGLIIAVVLHLLVPIYRTDLLTSLGA